MSEGSNVNKKQCSLNVATPTIPMHKSAEHLVWWQEWLPLPPHSYRVPDLNPGWLAGGPFCVECVCSPQACVDFLWLPLTNPKVCGWVNS